MMVALTISSSPRFLLVVSSILTNEVGMVLFNSSSEVGRAGGDMTILKVQKYQS